jgi:Asp-tRNA(Asn)/Glu-tRNA(Gln) amidotransferase A subunit family amidase
VHPLTLRIPGFDGPFDAALRCAFCGLFGTGAMGDLAFETARALAAKLRKREISSLELLDHFLVRIDLFGWAGLASACYLPATVIPVGRTGGLPVGMQIVGPYLEDRTTLDLAGRLSELVGEFVPPSGYG